MQLKLQKELIGWLRPLPSAILILIFLTACATDFSNSFEVPETSGFEEEIGCPTEKFYSETFLQQAAEEFEDLPEGSLKEMILDYRVLRDQVRACQGVS